MSKTHCVIPDVQIKPGVPNDHLTWAAAYITEKKPDTIICLGDFADMQSLSSYDKGKKCFEGRRYTEDIISAKTAMSKFMMSIRQEQERLRRNKDKGWYPKFVLTLGNHENRIDRAINDDSKLDGLINVEDLDYARFGWEVIPYLQPITIDGVSYCHYYTSGILGRPVTSARMLLTKHHMSCVAGHQQGRDIAYGKRADGQNMTAIISGSYYLHDEDYLNPQTNNCWRGIWFLHEVVDGQFDELPLSINYLKQRYERKNK